MNYSHAQLLIIVVTGLTTLCKVEVALSQSQVRISSEKAFQDSQSNLIQNTASNNSKECRAFIDCDSVETQKLDAFDAEAFDFFGNSISISEEVMVVGTPGTDCELGRDCGSVYVYRLYGSRWLIDQKLTSPDPFVDDKYGNSVFISGDTIFVGVLKDDCDSGYDCGSVYVYRNNGKIWVEVQKLTAHDASELGFFGSSISIQGDILAVGAINDNCDNDFYCGSVYVFRFNGLIWLEEQKLNAHDAAIFDFFGVSISICDDVIVIGASGYDCIAGDDCGAVYIYRFDGTAWNEQQKLIASNAATNDFFGSSNAINGDTVVVGATGKDCEVGRFCGAVYIYRFNGSEWIERQTIVPHDLADDRFGTHVAIDGEIIAITSIGDDDCINGANCGSAYIYRYDGNEWIESHKLTASDAAHEDGFGASLSAYGDKIVIAATSDDCSSGDNCGSVYIFNLRGKDCNCNTITNTCEEDVDYDGVIECDICPDSVMEKTIVINGCDSGVTNTLFDDGCTMADVLSECVSDTRSRGRDVSCVTDVARSWLRDRLITGREYSRIVSCAAGSKNQRRNIDANNQHRKVRSKPSTP